MTCSSAAAVFAPGVRLFEIGPGTGTATRRLLALGANPLVAIEPDARLADFLEATNVTPALQVLRAPFEAALLEEGAFLHHRFPLARRGSGA